MNLFWVSSLYKLLLLFSPFYRSSSKATKRLSSKNIQMLSIQGLNLSLFRNTVPKGMKEELQCLRGTGWIKWKSWLWKKNKHLTVFREVLLSNKCFRKRYLGGFSGILHRHTVLWKTDAVNEFLLLYLFLLIYQRKSNKIHFIWHKNSVSCQVMSILIE